jgi:hypothetical protein
MLTSAPGALVKALQENTQIAAEKNGRKARKTAGKFKNWQNYRRPGSAAKNGAGSTYRRPRPPQNPATELTRLPHIYRRPQRPQTHHFILKNKILFKFMFIKII